MHAASSVQLLNGFTLACVDIHSFQMILNDLVVILLFLEPPEVVLGKMFQKLIALKVASLV